MSRQEPASESARAPQVTIAQATTDSDIDAVRTLFLEYVRAPDWEPGFANYLAQQDFSTELATLPGVYAPPHGVLLLARAGADLSGCVACKRLNEPFVCEMKRLWVRPAMRGLGVADRLVRQLMQAAREAGYRRMRLDTLPSMGAAQRLYARHGFTEIPAYVANPISGARFLEADLMR
jgi:ribosomal protein S18 acetylase RimI-like enzyme